MMADFNIKPVSKIFEAGFLFCKWGMNNYNYPDMSKHLTYKQSGVNIDEADIWTEQIKSLSKRTCGPRVLSGIGGFAGMFRLDFDEKLFQRNYRKPVLVACTDGVGTKILVARDAKKFDTIGLDLVAMSVNDMIVLGAEPLFFLDYLALGKLTEKREVEIVRGISVGCRESGCSLIGGETAEMPDLYSVGDFDLAGFAVGVVEKDKIINGENIEPGDIILGLASSGLHSNGFSLVRKVIFEKMKLGVNDLLPGFGCSVSEEILRPTRIYVRSIFSVLKKYKVKQVIRGMAHITGGGLPGNIPRILPEGCRAIVHSNSWSVPKIFKFLQAKGPVRRREMFRVFNMGIGMVLIVRPTFASSISRQLTRCGETVYKIGRITSGKRDVELR